MKKTLLSAFAVLVLLSACKKENSQKAPAVRQCGKVVVVQSWRPPNSSVDCPDIQVQFDDGTYDYIRYQTPAVVNVGDEYCKG